MYFFIDLNLCILLQYTLSAVSLRPNQPHLIPALKVIVLNVIPMEKLEKR